MSKKLKIKIDVSVTNFDLKAPNGEKFNSAINNKYANVKLTRYSIKKRPTWLNAGFPFDLKVQWRFSRNEVIPPPRRPMGSALVGGKKII